MARSEAEIQAALDSVRAAMSEASSVTHGDRSTTNRSMSELRQAEQLLKNELASVTAARQTKSVRFLTSKGL